MAFHSLEYALLFVATFAAAWLLAGALRWRTVVLLVASYGFYASWDPRYLVLIFLSSTVDFFAGRRLADASSQRAKKGWLAFSLLINLGILGTFKYWNFFAQSLQMACLAAADWTVSLPRLHTALPVGISFYTFQSMSYTIDIYRGRLRPTDSYLRYLLYVSFFPQLVAGPIVRAADLLPQLAAPPRLDSARAGAAMFAIAVGLVKKVVVADYLGVHLVDPVFGNPDMYTAVESWAAMYGYAFQIYADFSAYSDIAIGSAALLGYTLPMNFDAPYRAANLREFWQRWHISLSTWLRDYLYIPLGGSRRGPWRTGVNLMITMVLGGLWHGASLTFVVWGALHGVALVATRGVQRAAKGRLVPRWVGTLVTFHVVCLAWVFFRAADFDTAWTVLHNLVAGGWGVVNVHWPAVGVLAAIAAAHWMPREWMDALQRWFAAWPAPAQGAALAAVCYGVSQMAVQQATPFIYFQF